MHTRQCIDEESSVLLQVSVNESTKIFSYFLSIIDNLVRVPRIPLVLDSQKAGDLELGTRAVDSRF